MRFKIYSFHFGAACLARGICFLEHVFSWCPPPVVGQGGGSQLYILVQVTECVWWRPPSFGTKSARWLFKAMWQGQWRTGGRKGRPQDAACLSGSWTIAGPTVTHFLRACDSSSTDPGPGYHHSWAQGLFPGCLGDNIMAQAGLLHLKRSDSG